MAVLQREPCCCVPVLLANASLQEFPERTVAAVPCDVSKPAEVQALVSKAAQELGRIVSNGCACCRVYAVHTHLPLHERHASLLVHVAC